MKNLSPFAAARRHGFTLMEMLVVLTIMAVLTTVAVQSLEPIAQKSRIEATQRTLDGVRSALHTVTHSAGSTTVAGFLADMRRLPVSFEELYVNGTAAPLWRGPYVLPPAGASGLLDAWQRPLRMTFADVVGTLKASFDSLQDTIVLSSDGPDGVVNTADDVVERLPASQLSARELRVRLYAVDEQGNPLDLSATEPTVAVAAVGVAGTSQATVAEGMDRVYTLTATPAELLAGSYQITVGGVTAPAGETGTTYLPTTRVSVLPGGTHTVDLLVFRGSQAPTEPEPMP